MALHMMKMCIKYIKFRTSKYYFNPTVNNSIINYGVLVLFYSNDYQSILTI